MLILPAIDLKGGRCVRLQQGEMDRETLFSDHPEEMAGRWESLGAKMLHIVDLDGAVAGTPHHEAAIKRILQSVSIPLELGGGIRSLDTIEHYLSLGVNPVVLGTILGLENTKVKVNERGWINVNNQMKTDDPDIFAIGDIVGEPMLAHKASHEGRVAVEVIPDTNQYLSQWQFLQSFSLIPKLRGRD